MFFSALYLLTLLATGKWLVILIHKGSDFEHSQTSA